jgi:hypothetical protein
MPLFPTLKTGAIAQYPATVKVSFGPTRSVEFLDGTAHRYCTGPAALRHWQIRMDHLDGVETAGVLSFLRANQAGTFSFTDPLTGDVAPRCIVGDQQVHSAVSGEADGIASFLVEELP